MFSTSYFAFYTYIRRNKPLSAACFVILVSLHHNISSNNQRRDIDEYKYKLDGKTILLIDDVKTTGSTLNECAKMLKIYGAKNVYAAAFAATKKETEL